MLKLLYFTVLDALYFYPLLITASFTIILLVRRLAFPNLLGAAIYYITLLIISLFFTISTMSVQHEMHLHLQDFIQLEQNNQLTEARNDPNPHNPTLQGDLVLFNNSDEFREFIAERDIIADKALGVCIALFTAILVDLLIIIISRTRKI